MGSPVKVPLRRMVHRQMPFQTQTAANWGNSLLVACSLKGNLALPRVCTAPDLRNIKVGLAEGIGVPALDMSPALKIPKGGWLVKAAGWATSCRNSHAGAQLETSQLFQDGHVVRPGRLPARQPEAQPNHFQFRCAENPMAMPS